MRNIFFIFLFCLSCVCSRVGNAAEITSPFGWRVHPVSGEYKFHTGIDVGYEYGTPIIAMLDGRVVYAAEYGGYGKCVILEHENGDYTLYAHCSELRAEYGSKVTQGEVIAYVGDTGIATGPHLHLELWRQGEYVDPVVLFE